MEFKDKIQKLRTDNKLTQEQLAEKLYVSRTAISKWESGKGYPNIDTLKDISNIFHITLDDLLSTSELVNIAQEEKNTNLKKTNNLIYGLIDAISILFIFLPIYANNVNDFIYSVPLINSNSTNITIKIVYIIILSIISIIGITELILNVKENKKIQSIINKLSIYLEVISIMIFIISRQTYLTTIIFIILIIKIILLLRNLPNKKELL